MYIASLIATTLLCAPLNIVEEKDPFPKRKDYPELQYVLTEELQDLRDKGAIVVDARNAVEFRVINIVGATNLSSSSMKKNDLLALRKDQPDLPIIFYCNGPTCSKSFKAGEKARAWRVPNCFVYDSGVLQWAEANPKETLFFGDPMSKETVQDKLISQEEFKAACLEPAEFMKLVRSGDYVVFDIRDQDERSKRRLMLDGVLRFDLDQVVSFLSKPGAIPKAKILFVDRVGKQVRWLQYYLERSERTEYFFIDGGIEEMLNQGYDTSGNKVAR